MVDVNTFNELRDGLAKLVQTKFGEDAWVSEIFLHQDQFIYEKNQKLFRAKYSISDKGEVKFVGSPTEVLKEVSFEEK